MENLFNYIWVMGLFVTLFNAFYLKYQSKKHIAEKPELEDGYEKVFKGILTLGSLPWLIIMVGSLSGMTKSIFEYLNPSSLNPIVLIFHGMIILLMLLSTWWIYFKSGAEFLEEHPGLFKKSSFSGKTNMTAKQIKLFFPLTLIGGIIGLVMMWNSAIPVEILNSFTE